jgi:hypothetical protein
MTRQFNVDNTPSHFDDESSDGFLNPMAKKRQMERQERILQDQQYNQHYESQSQSQSQQDTDEFGPFDEELQPPMPASAMTAAPYQGSEIDLARGGSPSILREDLSVISEGVNTSINSDAVRTAPGGMPVDVDSDDHEDEDEYEDDESPTNSERKLNSEAILSDLNDMEKDPEGNMEVLYTEPEPEPLVLDTTSVDKEPTKKSFLAALFSKNKDKDAVDTPKTADDEFDEERFEDRAIAEEKSAAQKGGGMSDKLKACPWRIIVPVSLLAVLIIILSIVFGVRGSSGQVSAKGEEDQTTPVIAAVTASAREEELYLSMASVVSGEFALDDTSTPQRKALQWIGMTDAQQLIGTDPEAKERYALAVLFYAAGGEGILDQATVDGESDAWLSDSTVCDWTFITCDATSLAVVQLNLFEGSLQGTLPMAEIAALSSLVTLDVHDNLLNGDISTLDFTELPSLEYLDLSANLISGSIPDSFYTLSNLQYLYLSENKLDGVLSPIIDGLTALIDMRIDNNKFSGNIPDELFTLSTFSTYCKVSSLSFLLLPVRLHCSRIWSPFFFVLSFLRTEVAILHTNQFSGAMPSTIDRAVNLHFLDLSNNQLTEQIPASFYDATNLKRVYLNANQLSGAIPSDVQNLTRLRALWLQNNSFTGQLPKEMRVLDSLGKSVLTVEYIHHLATQTPSLFCSHHPHPFCTILPYQRVYWYTTILLMLWSYRIVFAGFVTVTWKN